MTLGEICWPFDTTHIWGTSSELGQSSTTLSREGKKRERTYMSAEQKSVRARYILVAAITNVTIAGVWNIYVAKVISTLAYTRKKTRAYEIPGSYHFERNRVQ
jgi:hypothetical protein